MIVGYVLLEHACSMTGCKKPAVIEVKYKEKNRMVQRYWCNDHSPINIEAEKRKWLDTLMTPPGS